MAVVYNHATYLFVYNCSHVVIMSVHDYVLIADFLWCLRAVNDFFPLCVVFWFSLFMPAAMLDHAITQAPSFKIICEIMVTSKSI